MSSNGAATGPDTPEWSNLLAKPRRLATEVRRSDVPERPGVYAWFRDGE